MAGDNEISLIIRIKNFATEEIKKVGKDLGDMAGKAKDALLGAGLSFAGLTASMMKTVDAARESEEMVNKLNVALANQGNYSAEASQGLQDYATQLQAVTRFDDEAIVNAEALIASFGFEGDTLKQITKATLDLAQAKGMDLASAASLVAKSLGTSTNALKKQGIEVDGLAGSTDRANSFIKEATRLYGGQAEAAAKGLGATISMKNQMQDLAEKIGAQFAPALELTNRLLAGFIKFMNEHPVVFKIAAGILAFGVALTGIVTALGLAATILPVITLGFSLLGGAISFAAGALAVLGAPITLTIAAIGLLIGAILLFRQQFYDATRTVANFFLDMVKGILTGIQALLEKMQLLFNLLNKIPGVHIDTSGAIDNLENLKKNLEDMKLKQIDFTKDDKKTKAEIVKNNADAKNQIKEMDDQEYADKKQKLDLWVSDQEAAKTYTLQRHIDYINGLLTTEALSDKQRRELEIARNQLIVKLDDQNFQKKKADLDLWVSEQQAAGNNYYQEYVARLNAILKDEKLSADQRVEIETARNKAITESNAQQAKDFKTWQDFMKGAVTSSNKEVATIAKAMAIYDIGINTYKAAMAAYGAMAGIPFIGPVLGAAAAAAAIAYGAEQVGKVQSQAPALAEGGMIRGGAGMMTVIGEPGPRGSHDEAVVPLDDPTTARRIQEAAGGSGDTTVVLRVGEFDIANAVIRGYNKGRNLDLVTQIASE